MPFQRFKKKDPNDMSLLEAKEKAKVAAKEALAHARKCLDHELFVKYTKEYHKAERATIDQLFIIDKACFEPTVYAFKVKEIVSRLRHLKALYSSVTSDAGEAG